VTYFRTRKCTIIGAVLFHGPVRDGKGWVQNAMAAKRNLYALLRLRQRSAKWGEGCLVVTAELLAVCIKVIGSSRTGN
jgi:hypothetical protein